MRATAAFLLLAAPALAQTPAGPQFTVHPYNGFYAHYAQVASHPGGDFVVAWHEWSLGTGESRELVQRYNRYGVRLGSELVVSGTGPGGVLHLDLATLPGGGFVVAWEEYEPDRYAVATFARLFDGAGVAGPAFRVNSDQTDVWGIGPVVAVNAAGEFDVMWVQLDGLSTIVTGQSFDAGGGRRGAEFVVSPRTTGFQYMPGAAFKDDGELVVVWGERKGDGNYVQNGQRLSATGMRRGADFPIDGATPHHQRGPVMVTRPGGSFTVAWLDDRGQQAAVRMRRFDAGGTALGPGRVLHFFPPDELTWAPATLTSSLGQLVTAWRYTVPPNRSVGVRLGRFDLDGVPQGPPLKLGDPIPMLDPKPEVASDAGGRLVVVWGASDFEIHGQRIGRLGAPALAVDTSAGGSSDGNQVLEPGETVALRPSWQNNNDTAEALAGSLTALRGPGGFNTIADGTGDYGTVPAGATRPCGDCYAIGVSAPSRPVRHWDVTASEAIADLDGSHYDWSVHVGDSFGDVPRGSPFYRFAETLLHRGVTAGCGDGSVFCPRAPVTREQMASFVLTAREETGYRPRFCTAPRYGDVPASNPYCSWIEELARRGVSSGCGGRNFCPGAAVSREQMAVFLLRTLDPALNPPACTTTVFGDVPAASPFCRWIEELVRRGVTAGCGGGNYCPAQAVTREEMAAFLTTTFGLTLYGP